MTTLFLDTETIPEPMTLWDGLALDTPPGNYSKPETIEKWRREHAGEGWRKLAVRPRRNEVVCVAWMLRTDAADYPIEVESLGRFATLILPTLRTRPTIVAHNAPWDLWTLWFNLMRIGHVEAARLIARELRAKPWERRVVDTCAALRVDGDRTGPSLDRACKLFGIATPKGAVDGSKVLDLWASGDQGRAMVRNYCRGDVRALVELYDVLVDGGLA